MKMVEWFKSLSGGMVYAADLGSVATSVEVRILSKALFPFLFL